MRAELAVLPFSAALGIFAPYPFPRNQYRWLICGPCFHRTAYVHPSAYLLESLLKGDSSDKRWGASISASGFAGSGLRARLSNLKAGVGWVTSVAPLMAVPCASSPRCVCGGGGIGGEPLRDAERRGKEEGSSIGKSSVAQGGLWYSAGGEGASRSRI